ncbi:crcB-like family protein [Mycobacterium xenopi 4042]|uniref:Fluoride-specific ion channel n=1 Tax=Mycobacterium xenopi 4042 TaxID=1299334 RepID=X7Z533_MYCXE|nr:crcB-like family protein [Mycobacterium xenopi 4042]EUA33814.1 crcB-like family protein [Mycobacterium xenopi 3993]
MALGHLHREHSRRLPGGLFHHPVAGAIAAVELSPPAAGHRTVRGLTTFSTLQVETLAMIEHGEYGLVVGYGTASIGLGLLAVYLATALVRRVPVRG